MARPALHPSIQVLPGTDVDAVWDRFEVFEALHHTMQICNPMRSHHLDELLDILNPTGGARILDIACGYGEVLMRCAERACSAGSGIVGTGIDLSPWMITAAHVSSGERVPATDLTWVLGEARDFVIEPAADVCVCIGAEWVWHDAAGTARALAARLQPGGLAVLGAARLHLQADQEQIRVERGHVETVDDVAASLRAHGLEPVHRIDPTDDDWDAYMTRTKHAVTAWQTAHSGPRADRWVGEQADWARARDQDRNIIGWSLWIARHRG